MAEGRGDVYELIREMLLIGVRAEDPVARSGRPIAGEILVRIFLHRPSLAREFGFRYSALLVKAVAKGRDDLSTVSKR